MRQLSALGAIIGIALGLLGCGTTSQSGALDPLSDLLAKNGEFELVAPPRDDVEPGTVLERGKTPSASVPLATRRHTAPEATIRRANAAFMSEWSREGKSITDFSLLAHLIDSQAPPTSIEAKLSNEHVSSYRLSFGPATIESIPVAEFVDSFRVAPEVVAGWMRDGNQVIIETLAVDGIKITFQDQQGRELRLATATVMDALGAELTTRYRINDEQHVERGGRLVIGVKRRDLGELLRRTPQDADEEPNDTIELATPISESGSLRGGVGAGDDSVDHFQFTPPADGYFSFTVSARGKRAPGNKAAVDRPRLLDASGREVARMHDSRVPLGVERSSEPIGLGAGVPVFVQIRPHLGLGVEYTLSWSFEPNRR